MYHSFSLFCFSASYSLIEFEIITFFFFYKTKVLKRIKKIKFDFNQLCNMSEVFQKFLRFRSFVKNQFNCYFNALQCDHGCDFI